MSCSPARLEANRQNALKSTGPRTAAGKAASRFNACQHGLAGAADLVAPGEDEGLIARRAVAFARELDAPGAVGQLLAHRAALLSVRMERAAEHDLAVVATQIETARTEFDEDRRAAFDDWVAALDAPGDPREALAGLATLPEGVTHLTLAWGQLRAAIAAHDEVALARGALWLGRGADSPPLDLLARVDAELARLRALADSTPQLAATLGAARAAAGELARFDPSPAATLARRYEAAAERGMYRAIRAIADLRRTQAQEGIAAPLVPPVPAPPRPVPPPRSNPEPLGSFRAAVVASAPALPEWMVAPAPPALLPAEPRKQRPDLRKLDRKRS